MIKFILYTKRMVGSTLKKKTSNIKKAFSTGLAIGINDSEQLPYNLYNVSFFGILEDTKTSVSLEDVTQRIYDLLDRKNIYIEKHNDKDMQSARRTELINALNKVGIDAPLANNTSYLRGDNRHGQRDRAFLMVNKV